MATLEAATRRLGSRYSCLNQPESFAASGVPGRFNTGRCPSIGEAHSRQVIRVEVSDETRHTRHGQSQMNLEPA